MKGKSMSTDYPASPTPNVNIKNPKTRETIRTILDSFGGLAFIATAVDVAAPGIDLALWTVPALAGYAAARVVFGFAVDNPNTPPGVTMRRNRQVAHQTIKPETIDVGDIIEVQFPDDGGITTIKRGVVAYIQRHAGVNHFLTQQGSVIARYMPGTSTKDKYTLIARMNTEQPMLDMFQEMGRL